MVAVRDTYKYYFKVGDRIVNVGVTIDLDRREKELQVRWPDGRIEQVGRKMTREHALTWKQKEAKSKGVI